MKTKNSNHNNPHSILLLFIVLIILTMNVIVNSVYGTTYHQLVDGAQQGLVSTDPGTTLLGYYDISGNLVEGNATASTVLSPPANSSLALDLDVLAACRVQLISATAILESFILICKGRPVILIVKGKASVGSFAHAFADTLDNPNPLSLTGAYQEE